MLAFLKMFSRNVAQSGAWLAIFEVKVLRYYSDCGMPWGGRRTRRSAMEQSLATEYDLSCHPSISVLTPLRDIKWHSAHSWGELSTCVLATMICSETTPSKSFTA